MDIRWEQRFSNYLRAMDKLQQSVEYIHKEYIDENNKNFIASDYVEINFDKYNLPTFVFPNKMSLLNSNNSNNLTKIHSDNGETILYEHNNWTKQEYEILIKQYFDIEKFTCKVNKIYVKWFIIY